MQFKSFLKWFKSIFNATNTFNDILVNNVILFYLSINVRIYRRSRWSTHRVLVKRYRLIMWVNLLHLWENMSLRNRLTLSSLSILYSWIERHIVHILGRHWLLLWNISKWRRGLIHCMLACHLHPLKHWVCMLIIVLFLHEILITFILNIWIL